MQFLKLETHKNPSLSHLEITTFGSVTPSYQRSKLEETTDTQENDTSQFNLYS